MLNGLNKSARFPCVIAAEPDLPWEPRHSLQIPSGSSHSSATITALGETVDRRMAVEDIADVGQQEHGEILILVAFCS